MTDYTIAVRERGKKQAFAYIDINCQVQDTPNRCKPLTRTEATLARKLFIKAGAKAGRPVECRVVML